MSQPTVYRCIESVVDDSQVTYFTEGRLYQGEPGRATPSGEWAVEFTDDDNEPHLITSKALRRYFVKVEPLEAQS